MCGLCNCEEGRNLKEGKRKREGGRKKGIRRVQDATLEEKIYAG